MKASPQRMMTAVLAHNNLIQKAKLTNFGHIIEQEGDSYAIVFENAGDAVKFCLQVRAPAGPSPVDCLPYIWVSSRKLLHRLIMKPLPALNPVPQMCIQAQQLLASHKWPAGLFEEIDDSSIPRGAKSKFANPLQLCSCNWYCKTCLIAIICRYRYIGWYEGHVDTENFGALC